MLNDGCLKRLIYYYTVGNQNQLSDPRLYTVVPTRTDVVKQWKVNN